MLTQPSPSFSTTTRPTRPAPRPTGYTRSIKKKAYPRPRREISLPRPAGSDFLETRNGPSPIVLKNMGLSFKDLKDPGYRLIHDLNVFLKDDIGFLGSWTTWWFFLRKMDKLRNEIRERNPAQRRARPSPILDMRMQDNDLKAFSDPMPINPLVNKINTQANLLPWMKFPVTSLSHEVRDHVHAMNGNVQALVQVNARENRSLVDENAIQYALKKELGFSNNRQDTNLHAWARSACGFEGFKPFFTKPESPHELLRPEAFGEQLILCAEALTKTKNQNQKEQP